MPQWLAYVVTFIGAVVLALFVREILGGQARRDDAEADEPSTSAKLPFLELKVSEALSGALLGLAMMVGPWVFGVVDNPITTATVGSVQVAGDQVEADPTTTEDGSGDDGEQQVEIEYPVDCVITSFAPNGSIDLAGDCQHLTARGRQLQDGTTLLASSLGGGAPVLSRCTASDDVELWLRYDEDDGEPVAAAGGWVHVGAGETLDLDPVFGSVLVHPRDFNRDITEAVSVLRAHVNDDIGNITVSIGSPDVEAVATCFRDAASDGDSNRVELRWNAP